MTTHPPGQPSGPTGPGRDDPEFHSTNIGEPNEFSTPAPLPRLGGMVRDCEHLLAQVLHLLDRDLDPASLPSGLTGHAVAARRVSAGYHVEQALADLAAIGDMPLPAVGSATRLPVAAGKEPAPGSAAALRGAARESTGPVDVGPGAGVDPDSPPSVTPVAPGRGVGPGVIGPEMCVRSGPGQWVCGHAGLGHRPDR